VLKPAELRCLYHVAQAPMKRGPVVAAAAPRVGHWQMRRRVLHHLRDCSTVAWLHCLAKALLSTSASALLQPPLDLQPNLWELHDAWAQSPLLACDQARLGSMH
jgi:hypothetical protein